MKKRVAAGGSGYGKWVVLLLVFLLTAVFIVTLLLNRVGSSNGEQETEEEQEIAGMSETEKSSNAALKTCNEIEKGFLYGEFNFSGSREKFAEDFDAGGKIYKVYLAICYADFAYRYTGSVGLAIEITSKAEEMVENGDKITKRNYYAVLRKWYSQAGNEKKVNEISAILDEIDASGDDLNSDIIINGGEE